MCAPQTNALAASTPCKNKSALTRSLSRASRPAGSQEDGVLDFNEFSQLVQTLDTSMTVPPGLRIDTASGATRKYIAERRRIVLWRRLFNRLDTLPRDGYLTSDELRTAMLKSGVSVTPEQVRFQLQKYDANGDNLINFDEFSKFATDLISSSVQYSRALTAAQLRLEGDYARAASRADRANAQHANESYTLFAASAQTAISAAADDEELGRMAEAELVRIEKRIDRETFTEALSVLRTQDDLYRRFKVKYSSVTCGSDFCIDLADYLTPERVQLLDAIKVTLTLTLTPEP